MYTQGYNDAMSQLGLDKTAGVGDAFRAGKAAIGRGAAAVGNTAGRAGAAVKNTAGKAKDTAVKVKEHIGRNKLKYGIGAGTAATGAAIATPLMMSKSKASEQAEKDAAFNPAAIRTAISGAGRSVANTAGRAGAAVKNTAGRAGAAVRDTAGKGREAFREQLNYNPGRTIGAIAGTAALGAGAAGTGIGYAARGPGAPAPAPGAGYPMQGVGDPGAGYDPEDPEVGAQY